MQCGMVGTLFVALLVQCMLGLVSAFMYFEMSRKYDQFILLGTLFQLNCTMKQYPVRADVPEGYNVTKTMILKGSHELPTDVDIVFYQEDWTLAVTIPSVTLEHDGTYNCYYGNDSILQSVKPVHVGEPPSKPESIVCVSNNLNDLKCSFTLSRKSTNIPIRWIMEYRLSDVPHNATTVNCSKSSDLVFSCEPCPVSVFTQFASYEILIKGVNVDFELQVNESFPVKLNQSIVRPDPVTTLRVAFTNVSSEIKLLWDFPKGLMIFTMQYKIVITSGWDNRTLHKEGNEEHEEYLVTKLVPYTNYWVTVEAKPVEAVGDIYWSSKSAVDFWTESDICEHTVSMTTGSYMVMDCEHAMCAVLYWKNPARKDWNGNITSYRVLVQMVKLAEYTVDMAGDRLMYRFRHVTKGWLENVTGIAVSGVLKGKLTKTDNYSMRMMIMNSAGISSNYIEIVIPNMDKGETLKVEWVSVEMASSTISVSWHMDPKNCDAVRSVTYYWGLADTNSSVMNEYTVYKDEIDWRTFDISDGCGNQASHQFEKFLYQSNTRYGVSVGTGQISGGMVMESFRFNKQNDVADMPQYTVSADRDRLQVHILYTDYYVSEGGRPVQYQIVYSEDSGKDDCPLGGHINKFPTDFTNPVLEINNLNLKAGVQYKVCVAALNAAGIGRYGEPVITKTPEDNSAITMVLFIIVSGFAIMCVVFAVFIYNKCSRRFYRFKIDTQNINIPFRDEIRLDGIYTENAAQKTYLNKLSDDHDSGKGSDSPASSSNDINQLQQDGVRVSPNTSSCNVSTVFTEDDGPDRSRERRVSSALSGYLKVVTSNNSVGMLGCLDDENDSIINGEHISYERNRGKRRINNIIDGELSCSNCDEDLNITKATLGNVPRRNEHLPNNANNATGNAILPNGNEYLPNGNDQEIHRFIAGVPNLQQESPNSNPVYVDEHDARKVPTNVKAYVPNEAKMFPKRLHFYMEVDDAVSGVLNVNRRRSDSTEVELNDSQIDEKIGENVETSFLNSQKLVQENSIGVMNSVQQSKDNLKAKARLPNRERKQEAIDSNNDALQSSHDYQTHPNCNVKANEDMISDYVEAETSNDMDTFEHDRDITSEETAALCAVITDFEKNPSTEGNLEGRVNTEYNGSFVNMMRRSSQDSTSRYNDEDVFSNTFDNLYFDNLIDSNIGHYKNPDEISLGQGSTISDCSDTTSIKSSESLFETPVLEVCKELQDFVEAADVVDEGNGDKVEVKHNVKNDKKIKEEGKHAEVGDHIEKSRGKCSVHSGDSEHGESFSSESSKNTSDTGNVVSYMITGLESATDGIQEFNLQNTEITDRKARKGTSLNDASTEHAGNAFDS